MKFKDKKNLVGFLSAVSIMAVAILVAAIFAKNATVQRSFSASYSCFACGGSQGVIYKCALSNPATSSCASTALSNCASDSNCSGGTTTTCSGGQYLSGGSCHDCSAGTYSTGGTATSCTTCPSGQISGAKASSCSSCPASAACTDDHKTCKACSTTPTSCPAGQGLVNGECTNCSAGYYSPSGSTACARCSGDTYSGLGASSCTACPSGKTANADNTACVNAQITCENGYISTTSDNNNFSCTLTCNEGYHVATAYGSCVQCSGETYLDYRSSVVYGGTVACRACPTGQCAINGHTACGACDTTPTSCPAGQGLVNGECTNCSAGYYSPSGSTTCSRCSDNTYSAEGARSCVACPTGQYANADHTGCYSTTVTCQNGYVPTTNDDNNINCTLTCSEGHHVATANGSCVECSGNTYLDYRSTVVYGGTVACRACPTGQCAINGHTACGTCSSTPTSCPEGKGLRDGECRNCDPGYYSPAGSTKCSICTENTFSPAGAASCTQCPSSQSANANHTACVDSHLTCENGYIPTTNDDDNFNCTKTCSEGYHVATAKGDCVECSGNTYLDYRSSVVYGGTVACRACPTGQCAINGHTACGSCGSGDTTTKYTITYNVNGGTAWTSTTCADSYTFTSSGSKCTKKISSGDTYGGFPTPTRDGYTFKEWNTKSDGTGTTITATDTVNSSRTIYAIWESNDLNITVTPKNSIIGINDTVALTATVKPDSTPNKSVTWTSSDSTIASVDENGVVTGKKIGTVTITATTVEGNKSDTATVEVKQFACPAGQYLKENGTSLADCEPCPAGTYSNSGAVVCTPCVENTYTSTSGQSSCAVCGANEIANTTHTACQERPEGAVTCAPGTYLKANGVTSDDCEICPAGYYCPGGDFAPATEDQGKNLCSLNHIDGESGTIVQEFCKIKCLSGTYKANVQADKCVACPSGKTSKAHLVNYDQVSPSNACYSGSDSSNPKTGLFEVGGALIGVLGLGSVAYIILKKRKIINI